MDRNRPLLVDCDPGLDDVLAIAAAASAGDLVAVTTVAGNAPLATTTALALLAVEALGLAVPVHAGADRPLTGPAPERDRHGSAQLLDGRPRRAADGDAADAIIETVRAHPGTWIVVTGPATNVATALRRSPGLAADIGGIAMMGGDAGGGIEFNVNADPKAHAEVIAARCEVRRVGLELTQLIRADAAMVARIASASRPGATFLGATLEHLGRRYEQAGEPFSAPLHDPVAVLLAVEPELFEFESEPGSPALAVRTDVDAARVDVEALLVAHPAP